MEWARETIESGRISEEGIRKGRTNKLAGVSRDITAFVVATLVELQGTRGLDKTTHLWMVM
jgi:hypothetical protein